MDLSFRAIMVVLLTVSALAAETGLPGPVAERLDEAVTPSETSEFQGSFTMSVATMVQKPGGKSREEVTFIADVVNRDDGEQTRHLVQYIENSVDVTEDQRTKFEKRDPADKKKDDDGDFANPFGDTADLYRFGPPESVASVVVVAFEPAPGHEDDKNVATGRVAWNPVTLEPAWLEMEAIRAPKPLKRLAIRLEFTRQGDHTFVTSMVTDGLAKVLLMQREFHTDLRFDNIQPTGSILP